MRIYLIVVSFFILISQPAYSWQEKLSYDVDLDLTKQAPWKIGEVVFSWADDVPGQTVCGSCKYDNDLNNMSEMRRLFLGVTPQGNYLVQEFYKSQNGRKLTDSYLINNKEGVTRFDTEPYTLFKKVVWYPNGQKMKEGYFDNGQRQGIWTFWYPNGKMQVQGPYQNGERNGVWTFYNESGHKRSEAKLVNGKNEGLSIEWDENGVKIKEA